MSTTFIQYFKVYFNITTQPVFMVTGAKLQSFIATYGASILTTDPEYSEQTQMLYEAYSGNTINSLASTQKWVKPHAGLLNPIIIIALVAYQKTGNTDEYFLRVSNTSIVNTSGYPGIAPPGGGGNQTA